MKAQCVINILQLNAWYFTDILSVTIVNKSKYLVFSLQNLHQRKIEQTKKTGFYDQKLNVYQWDEEMLLSKHKTYGQYVEEFAKKQKGKGLDAGAGPNGPMSAYFTECSQLHGFDVTQAVVNTLPAKYVKKFVHDLGSEEKLPYDDNTFDFVVCSSVIQHLASWQGLVNGVREMARVLKPGGQFFFMFKAGTTDTVLTNVNKYYNELRSFRVFEPVDVQKLCQENGLQVQEKDISMSIHWIGYCQFVFKKK